MMRTVKCDTCGVAFSAEELAIAQANLDAHVGVHAGDNFTSAGVVELLNELKSARDFFTGIANIEAVGTKVRQAAMFRVNEINRILS